MHLILIISMYIENDNNNDMDIIMYNWNNMITLNRQKNNHFKDSYNR